MAKTTLLHFFPMAIHFINSIFVDLNIFFCLLHFQKRWPTTIILLITPPPIDEDSRLLYSVFNTGFFSFTFYRYFIFISRFRVILVKLIMIYKGEILNLKAKFQKLIADILMWRICRVCQRGQMRQLVLMRRRVLKSLLNVAFLWSTYGLKCSTFLTGRKLI